MSSNFPPNPFQNLTYIRINHTLNISRKAETNKNKNPWPSRLSTISGSISSSSSPSSPFLNPLQDPDCVYTVYIRTGSIWKGGTDSTISLTVYDAAGYGIRINNFEAWGELMGPGHDYYERGNLDIFSGRGPCLTGPVCQMNLTSDGSGPHHGWYCNYVEVSSTGVHKTCAQQKFTVEQWLATDAAPYELTAIRDYCGNHVVVGGDGSSLLAEM